MSIKRTIITTIVTLALVAMVAPGVAQGVTIEELLAQIAQLQAQLLALQGGSTTTGSVPAACTGVTFTRALTVGSTGSDVKCLQAILNLSATTKVASTGAGSPGSETSYFGSLTLAAVKIYQAEHGWTPANQVGPLTRQALNAFLSSGTTTPGTPVVPTGAGLTVALASNNPASGSVVDGQALAPLARLTFTNGDNASVTVTGLKLKRIGISADASLTNIYLFDGAVRLTDGASVSDTVITFNLSSGLFTVPAGSSKTISVLSDVDGTSGETVGVQVVASTDVTTNASSVKGIYPITGNLMTIATGTLAGIYWNATTTPTAASVDPQDDYTVFQNIITVATRAVDMTRITFRKTGSVANADLQSLRLYVDGVQVGSAQSLSSDGYVTFDLTSSPKRLEAGSRTLKLLANIVGGSSLNFTFHVWNVADATFVDSQYGANVLSTVTNSSTSFSKRSSGEQSVNSGTITFTKMSDSPSGNIVDGATNVTLAKYQVKAAGEPIKIETLYVSAICSTSGISGLRNGALYANGVQVGSTTTLYDPDDTSYDYTTFNLGSSLIVSPGSPVTLEVRADIYDTGTSDTTNSVVADTTIAARIEGSSSWNNAIGQVSASTIDAPATDVDGNTLTVKQGTLTLAKYAAYPSQTMVVPLTAAKLAHFTLTSTTTEAINITSIVVDLDGGTTGGFDASADVNNLYVVYGGNTSTVKSTVTDSANTWSINYVLAAGAQIDVIVYADVVSGATGAIRTDLDVSGTTVSSATAADVDEASGQTITIGSGSIASALDAGTPLAQVVAGGQQITAAKFKFTASNDTYTIRELKAKLSSTAATAAVVNAILKDGSTVLQTRTFDTTVDNTNDTAHFTGLEVQVPANTSKVLTVDLLLSTPVADLSTSQQNVKVTLDWFKPFNSTGTEYTTSVGTDRAGNNIYVFKSVPTFTYVPFTSSDLTTQGVNLTSGSTTSLYKVKVAADPKGDISLKQLKFKVTITENTTSSDGTLTLSTFKFFRGSTDITSSVSILDSSDGDLESTTTTVGEADDTIAVVFDTEENIPAGSYYEYTLKATPSGFLTNTDGADSVSTYLEGDSAVASDSSLYYLYQAADDETLTQTLASDYSGTGTTAESIIWSDRSAISHDYTDGATNSADWTNSVGTILGAPLDSQGVSAK